jgi:hypothetical protein
MNYIDALNEQLKHVVVTFKNGTLQIQLKKSSQILTLYTEKIPRDALLFSDALVEYFIKGNFADLCSGNGIIGALCMLHGGNSALSFDISIPNDQVISPERYQPIQVLADITQINFPQEYPTLNRLSINPPQLPGPYKESPADFGGERGDELLLYFIHKLTKDGFFKNTDNWLFISCFHPVSLSIKVIASQLKLRVKTVHIYKAPFLPTSLLANLDPITYRIEQFEGAFPSFHLYTLLLSNQTTTI